MDLSFWLCCKSSLSVLCRGNDVLDIETGKELLRDTPLSDKISTVAEIVITEGHDNMQNHAMSQFRHYLTDPGEPVAAV